MRQLLCVGTYTEPILFGTGEIVPGKGKGVYLCALEDGRLEVLGVAPVRNPSFLSVCPETRRIYAVNELKELDGQPGGGVCAISYEEDGAMTVGKVLPTGGGDPCHTAVSPDGRWLVVSNFAGGSVAAFAIGPDGDLTGQRQLFQHRGHGADPKRQSSPHAHSAAFDGGRRFYVPDLGLDRIVCYEAADGEVRHLEAEDLPLRPCTGPRAGVFSSDGAHYYVLGEMSAAVTHFQRTEGGWEQRETVSILPPEPRGAGTAADLHLTRDGRFLFTSNRGPDEFTRFRVGQRGELTYDGVFSCGGRTPRNFALDPTGQYLLSANQDSDTIAIFRLSQDGTAELLRQEPFPTPVCIRFF